MHISPDAPHQKKIYSIKQFEYIAKVRQVLVLVVMLALQFSVAFLFYLVAVACHGVDASQPKSKRSAFGTAPDAGCRTSPLERQEWYTNILSIFTSIYTLRNIGEP